MKKFTVILFDIVSMQLSFIVSYFLRHGVTFENIEIYTNLIYVNALIQICISLVTNPFESFIQRGYYKELKKVIVYVTNVVLVTFLFMFASKTSYAFSRMVFVSYWLISIVLTEITRSLIKFIAREQLKSDQNLKNIIIVGKKETIEKAISHINNIKYQKIKIIGVLAVDCSDQEISSVKNIDNLRIFAINNFINEAMFFNLEDKNVYNYRSMCRSMGLTVHDVIYEKTDYFEDYGVIEELSGYTVVTSSNKLSSEKQIMLKRIADILIGFIGAIITIILALFIGPLIYFSDKGPIFFSQERVGKNGKHFTMYKFRSMYRDSEEKKNDLIKSNEMNEYMFKIKDDPRIIKGIGSFIRKTSLDEFPQFLNVLKGDMSVVGTRPPTVDEYKKYSIHHMSRLAIKPGITGLWQVCGRNNITDFEEVVRLDNQYIQNWSLGLDFKIILKTIFVVFTKSGE